MLILQVICRKEISGAGEGNRTLIVSLGSCYSTIELHPLTFWVVDWMQKIVKLNVGFASYSSAFLAESSRSLLVRTQIRRTWGADIQRSLRS